MKLSEYVAAERGRQTELAKAIGCPPQLVWQWANEVRGVPLERCVPIELATGHEVMRWDLRPLDWHRIWPELVGSAGAPEAPADETQVA